MRRFRFILLRQQITKLVANLSQQESSLRLGQIPRRIRHIRHPKVEVGLFRLGERIGEAGNGQETSFSVSEIKTYIIELTNIII